MNRHTKYLRCQREHGDACVHLLSGRQTGVEWCDEFEVKWLLLLKLFIVATKLPLCYCYCFADVVFINCFFLVVFFIVGMLACKFNFIVLRMNALLAREAMWAVCSKMGHNKHCMYFVLTWFYSTCFFFRFYSLVVIFRVRTHIAACDSGTTNTRKGWPILHFIYRAPLLSQKSS